MERERGLYAGATTPRSGLAPGPRYRPRRRHPSRLRRSVQGATAARASTQVRAAHTAKRTRALRHAGDDGDARRHGPGTRIRPPIVPSSPSPFHGRGRPPARPHTGTRTPLSAPPPSLSRPRASGRSPSRGFWRAVRGCMRPSLLREKARVRPAGGGGVRVNFFATDRCVRFSVSCRAAGEELEAWVGDDRLAAESGRNFLKRRVVFG